MNKLKIDTTIEDLDSLYKDDLLMKFPPAYYAYRKLLEKWEKSKTTEKTTLAGVTLPKQAFIDAIKESLKEMEKDVRKEFTIDRERYRSRKDNERTTDFVYSPSSDFNKGE